MSGAEEVAAFERLYEQHFARIRSLCGQILRNSAAAEDMAQETLLRAWKRRAEIREEDVGAWLSVVARNLCISSMRREWRNVPVDELPETPNEELDPAAVVLSLDARRSVRSAFTRLGSRHRRVLYMREVGEADYDAIGSELGLTAEGARSIAFRARRVLRDHLVAVGEGFSGVLVGVRVRVRILRARVNNALSAVESSAAPAMQSGLNLALAVGVTLAGVGGVAAGAETRTLRSAPAVVGLERSVSTTKLPPPAAGREAGHEVSLAHSRARSSSGGAFGGLRPDYSGTLHDREDGSHDWSLTILGITYSDSGGRGSGPGSDPEDGFEPVYAVEDLAIETTCTTAPRACRIFEERP